MKIAGAPLGNGPTRDCGARKPTPTVVAMISTRISPTVTVDPRLSGASALVLVTATSLHGVERVPILSYVRDNDLALPMSTYLTCVKYCSLCKGLGRNKVRHHYP